MDKEVYESEVFSFTKNKSYRVKVSKSFLSAEDKVLIIDDFLANGNAAAGLIDIVEQSGGKVVGAGIVIEKSFQNGRQKIEDLDIKVESLAIVDSFVDGQVVLR
jgi:xanthine phosphoribosyltransferase